MMEIRGSRPFRRVRTGCMQPWCSQEPRVTRAGVSAAHLELALERELASASVARAALRKRLPSTVVGEDLLLLVSELVTNAVLHGGEPIELVLDLRSDAVHVEVRDRGLAMPSARHPDDHETSGRGLQIVDRMATRWGVEPSFPGKSVWFDLSLS